MTNRVPTPSHDSSLAPNIATSLEVAARVDIDPVAAGQTMAALGISSETIASTSVFVDDTSRLATKGITYPKWLGRIRHLSNPHVREVDGPIVRISSVVRGVERSEDDMNRTFVHESEHIAQRDRRDPKMMLGLAAIWGLASVGGVAANRLSRGHSGSSRIAATVVGAALGYQLGYQIAPHEVQARKRADTVHTSAIKRKRVSCFS